MILLKILIKILLRFLRRIKYISTYTCNTIKKMAAKPPTERSEANKDLLIHTATKPLAERSEANKVPSEL